MLKNLLQMLKATKEKEISYASYEEALNASPSNYEDIEIVNVMALATRQFVKALKSMPPKINISSSGYGYGMYALIYYFMHESKRDFRILEPGGACGAAYFHAKSLLGYKVKLLWHIVETPSMARAGANFANNELAFFSSNDIDEAQDR